LAGALKGVATVPEFLWCLLVGLVIRNLGAAVGLRLHDAASELIGAVCLSLFLTWTMMTLDLGEALSLAGPLLIILAAQTVLVAAWATWVTFPLVGREYESAITSGAFCGFAMDATATAIANMQALTRRHRANASARQDRPENCSRLPHRERHARYNRHPANDCWRLATGRRNR
jgi:ESS family glutamate:Na+ symporter